jgi:hypothetical protein
MWIAYAKNVPICGSLSHFGGLLKGSCDFESVVTLVDVDIPRVLRLLHSDDR